jgi:hypothetical protein
VCIEIIQKMNDLLTKHGVREPVLDTLLWVNPRRSAFLLTSGVLCFIIVHVVGIGMLTVIGTLAILQLFVFRIAQALQAKGWLIKPDVDLQELIVVTPNASTISTLIEIIGDILRNVEDSIKEISLTADYARLVSGIGILVFLSAVGRVVSLPVLLVLLHIGAFSIPLFYFRNQEQIDKIIANAIEATEIFIEKNFQTKVKLS